MFGPEQVVAEIVPSTIAGTRVADLDGDGAPDVLTASSGASWYRNELHTDCNYNGLFDASEIADDFTVDIDADGHLDSCDPPALSADKYELSLAVGGTQAFALRSPGSVPVSSFYFLLGSISGTEPGVAVGSLVVPLNPDSYLNLTFNSPNSPFLMNSLGALTPSSTGGGEARASLNLPPGLAPALIGLTAHHAFVCVDIITGAVNFASNAVPLALLP